MLYNRILDWNILDELNNIKSYTQLKMVRLLGKASPLEGWCWRHGKGWEIEIIKGVTMHFTQNP